MGSPTGFQNIERKQPGTLPVEERTQNFQEFSIPLVRAEIEEQGARCIDCGIPYCHSGCPVDNLIPLDDLVSLERRHLKDSFALIREIQESLAQRFDVDRLG